MVFRFFCGGGNSCSRPPLLLPGKAGIQNVTDVWYNVWTLKSQEVCHVELQGSFLDYPSASNPARSVGLTEFSNQVFLAPWCGSSVGCQCSSK